jgi:hypothetical protein
MYPYPATIRPAVSAETIGKVTRMFNGNLYDIIPEIFQNARRAGAGSIEIMLDESRSPPWAIIRDNGRGIGSPEHFVTLGRSGWGKDVREAEDPAGMGVFSLAGTRVDVTSRPEGAAIAWTASIEPAAWTGDQDIAIVAADHPVGTTIAFELTPIWKDQLADAVAHHARYLPIPVRFQGEDCPRRDWMDNVIYRANWKGCTIGVVEKYLGSAPSINFHGLTVWAELASVTDVRGKTRMAIVDMGPSNDIQLVLPARKEVVQNEAWADLKEAAERAIYAAIETLPDHQLGFAQWKRAAELGIVLPEASPVLERWRPGAADGSHRPGWDFDPVKADGPILMPPLDPVTANTFKRALLGDPMHERLSEPEADYVGYRWYDALPAVENVMFFVTAAGGDFTIVDGLAEPWPGEHVLADTIDLAFMLRHDACSIPYRIEADLAFVAEPACNWSSLDETVIVWRKCPKLTPDDVIDMLESAFFCPGHDHGDDSSDTQRERFKDEATDLVVEMMLGADEALCDQFRRALQSLIYTVPAGKQIEALVTRDGPVVRLIEIATEPA